MLDIFTNGAAIPSLEKANPAHWNRLFCNHGDGTFTDMTEKAGLEGIGYSMGVAAGDYDQRRIRRPLRNPVSTVTLFHNNGDGYLHRYDC